MPMKTSLACMKSSADHPTPRVFAFHRVIKDEIAGEICDLTILVPKTVFIISRLVFGLFR